MWSAGGAGLQRLRRQVHRLGAVPAVVGRAGGHRRVEDGEAFEVPVLDCCLGLLGEHRRAVEGGLQVVQHVGADDMGLIGQVRSEEHTSELQSLMRTSYAVFCLKKKKNTQIMKVRLDSS